jgi:hypothetical protein
LSSGFGRTHINYKVVIQRKVFKALNSYIIKMEYKRTFKDKIGDYVSGAGDLLKTGVKVAIGGYIFFSLASHNGCLDSNRTKSARQLHDENNPTKVVANIEEEWKDNSTLAFVSSAMGGAGYNPRVIRRVTFEDGTQTTLDYRVLAHQPFRKWIAGEEFNPKVGDKYEVTKQNQLVRELE